ncbi:uncharacterized protein EDB93DRAFT_616131 [Suillus bovinus]|uniref:uncharacterized protein n=1 Tax=Suillus bovinus TaxID=48563 RepID=UPI001B862374|nr:uncharacterized protein EDB93DRAFT_616131 [Suillus bovinus]KAG2123443.1 hypothetical protein EDB93DRAFT_616131 [Suillus bovinus]
MPKIPISAMHSTTENLPCASNESCLPLIATPLSPLQDTSATPSTHVDGAPLLSLAQPPNPRSCVIIIQNNYIAEGGTINILSSHCNGSTATKLEHVGMVAEPTPLDPPLVTQPEPAAHGCESIVLSGNTFGECVMINIGSPNCTGAVKQTALAS